MRRGSQCVGLPAPRLLRYRDAPIDFCGPICLRGAALGRQMLGGSDTLPRWLMSDSSTTPKPKPREFFIHGVTSSGRPFRPSDWSERLCGVMSSYRPAALQTASMQIGYSPYVRPTLVGGVKCVVVDERLRELERMAF